MQINFNIISNTKQAVISPSEVLDIFLPGIVLKSQDGKEISETTIKFYIDAATAHLEKYLGIKIFKQVITEDRYYYSDDFANWGSLRTSYPVRKMIKMEGKLNNVEQLHYPSTWLVAKKTNSGQYYRTFSVVPNGDGIVTSLGAPFYGKFPANLFNRASEIPFYWNLSYLTGYDINELPTDLISAIGKIVAIDLYNVANNFIIGPGLTGGNLSIDGLSQSINTAKSGKTGAFTPIIDRYLDDLAKNLLPTLKSYYKGPNMIVA